MVGYIALYVCDYKEWQRQVDTQYTPTGFENQSNVSWLQVLVLINTL